MNRVLLDFTNYEIKKDFLLLLVFLGFLCSCSHFVLEIFFPPYLTVEKLSMIATVYLAPCGIFFLLMREASDVEWGLMPLPKLVEPDPAWAKQHIAQCHNLSDSAIRKKIKAAVTNLYNAKEDHRFELDELIHEIVRICQGSNDGQDNEDGTHGLYKGMWPGRILLSPYLKD